MPAMESFVCLTTDQLAELNDAAIALGFDRRLSSAFMSKVEPSGTHVIGFTFIHSGECVRALMLVKVKDRVEPVHATLDIGLATYITLPRFGYDAEGTVIEVATGRELTFDEATEAGFDGTQRTSETPV